VGLSAHRPRALISRQRDTLCIPALRTVEPWAVRPS